MKNILILVSYIITTSATFSQCPTSGLFITEFVYDVCNESSLVDGGSPSGGEYIVLSNNSTAVIDLSGAEIDDDGDVTDGDGIIIAVGTNLPIGGCLIVAPATQTEWESEYGSLPAGCAFYDSSNDWEFLNNSGDNIGITGGCNNGMYTDLVADGEVLIWNNSNAAFEPGGVVSINPAHGGQTYTPGTASNNLTAASGVCTQPHFIAIATCANGMTDAGFDEYYVSVEVIDAGSAPGDVSVSVGSFTGSITGGTGTIVLGPFTFVDGLGDQMVTVADAAELSCNSTAEVSELRCGYTPDNGNTADSALNACGTFCGTQGSVTATTTEPALIAQATPTSVSEGETNSTNYVYVLVAAGNVESVNNSGLFTGLTNGTTYTVHAFNVLETDRVSFESQFINGSAYNAPSGSQCFSSCGSVMKTPNCFTCPTINALTATSPICSGIPTTDLDVTISGFDQTENGDEDYTIEFIYTTTQAADEAAVYALDISSVDVTQVGTVAITTVGVMTAEAPDFTLPTVTIQTTYYVYARILNAATVVPDANCRPFAETSIMVNPNPVAEINDATVCMGTTNADVNVATTSGTPTMYSLDYDATAEGVGFVDVSTSSNLPTYTIPANAAAGIYNGVFNYSDANGCSGMDPFTITVNANPIATLNNPTICMGSETAPITLTTTSGTPTMFAIDYDNMGITDVATTATLPMDHMLPNTLAVGDYTGTITYTDANGCSGTDEFTITVQAATDAGMDGTATVCNADPAQFAFNLIDSLVGTPTATGIWSETTTGTASGVTIGAGNEGAVNFQNVVVGTYEFTYTVPSTGSCPDATSMVTITVTNCFDLALTKVLTTTGVVKPGQNITFDIAVVNQGMVTAFDVDIEDYFDSSELAFVSAAISPNDTPGSSGMQFTNGFTIDQIAVGATAIVQITMTIDVNFTKNTIINNAEIVGAASVDGGPDAIDSDSTPDSEDGTVEDPNDGDTEMIDGSDDYDPATVMVCQSNCGVFPWDGTN